jgi:colanic acid/amylovoran biosynthesis protein
LVLNKAAVILVRDSISLEYVRGLELATPVFLAADSALQEELEDLDPSILLQAAGIADDLGPFVGMTPAELSWHPSRRSNRTSDQRISDEAVVSILAEIVDWLWLTYHARVVFFPQLFGAQSDMDIIRKVIAATREAEPIVLPTSMDSDDQQRLAGVMDLFVGMRYHSAIFAAKAGTPPVCIAYEHKAIGFMDSVGLAKYTIAVDDLNTNKLRHAIADCYENSAKIKQQLALQIPSARQKALLSSLAVKAVLTKPPRQSTRAIQRAVAAELESLELAHGNRP